MAQGHDARRLDQRPDVPLRAGVGRIGAERNPLRPSQQQLVCPHRRAAAEGRAEPELFQPHGLRPARRGALGPWAALLALDGAWRDLRPRQHARRGAGLSAAQRRGRQHASQRHDLLCAKRQRPLQGPAGRLPRRRETTQGPRRGGGNPQRRRAAEQARRARRHAGRGRLRLESLRQQDPARRDLRTLHQLRRRDDRQQSDAAFRVAPLRRGRDQRDRDRALRGRPKVPRPGDARPLRPRLHGGRIVLPVGALSLSTVDRRRPALPAVGERAGIHGRRRDLGRPGPRRDEARAQGPLRRRRTSGWKA